MGNGDEGDRLCPMDTDAANATTEDVAHPQKRSRPSSSHGTDDPPPPDRDNQDETIKERGASAENAMMIPQLAQQGITVSDMQTASRVLEALAHLNPRYRRSQQQQKKDKRKRRSPATQIDIDPDDKDTNQESTISSNASDNNNEEDMDSFDWMEAYQMPNLRPVRKALAACVEHVYKPLQYGGKSEEDYYSQRLEQRTLKRQKMQERLQQKKYIADTQLRRGRVQKLQSLKDSAKDEEQQKSVSLLSMLIPDGHVDTTNAPLAIQDNQQQSDDTTQQEEKKHLFQMRSCYVCKIRFRELHDFYDQLCPACASLNYAKRFQGADMTGRVAVVTGSRVKIGFQTCLKLLRANCVVVATSRFPNAAAAAYRKEPDFDTWKNRLELYGLDLRDVTGLEAFTRFLKGRFSKSGIDVLINNACQTVRRPCAYYNPILEKERDLWTNADATHKSLLGGCSEFEQVRRRLLIDQNTTSKAPALSHNTNNNTNATLPNGQSAATTNEPIGALLPQMAISNDNVSSSESVATVTPASTSNATTEAPFDATGISHSAAMSQMVILPEDVGVSADILPPGLSDINGHQLDLRNTNSWLLKLEDVSTPEVMECMFINAIAPFVLNSRLKPLMTTPQNNHRPDRYVINVSAMEGKFYRYKMPNHPHTNMAKAALNMLTRTSSEDLAKSHRIYMNSVDTGWINDENPLERANKTAKQNLFQTPIDEIDAAARILDPVFTGISADQQQTTDSTTTDAPPKKEKEYGKFLKDYRETEW